MKNIKYFKYKNTYNFKKFLNEYEYTINDVVGYSVSAIHHYHGDIFKSYIIYFNDDNLACFKVVYFKSLNEYHQCCLGFNGDTLLEWCKDANVVEYKVKDVWGLNDRYVIAN